MLPSYVQVVECQQAEDEYDCEWYKRSSIPSIHSFTEFTQVLNENDVVLVEFFAPWCPACVTFLPVLEDIDKTLTYENQNLAIYKVNTNLEKFTHLIFLEHSGQHRWEPGFESDV